MPTVRQLTFVRARAVYFVAHYESTTQRGRNGYSIPWRASCRLSRCDASQRIPRKISPLTAAEASNSATLAALRRLTQQQRDVLDLMMQGKSNNGICRILNLAKPTVKNHVAAILQTLNVTNRAEAVIKASGASALPVSNSSTPHTYLGYIPGAL